MKPLPPKTARHQTTKLCSRCEKVRITPSSRSGLCGSCYRTVIKGKYFDHPYTFKDIQKIAGSVERVAVEEQSGKNWLANVEVVRAEKIAVVQDTHIPGHDPQTLKRLALVSMQRGIKALVVNGDFLEWEALGNYPKSGPPGKDTPKEQLRRAVRVLGALLQVFEKITVVGGNHDIIRLERLIDSAMSGRGRPAGILADFEAEELECLDYETRAVSILERHTALELGELAKRISWHPETFCYHDPPQGDRWVITHQKASSRRAPYEALNIWQKYGCHILAAHTHLWGVTIAPNGKHVLANMAASCRREFMRWANRHDTAWPEWVRGFALIENGVLSLWPMNDALVDWKKIEAQQ